MRSEKKPGRGAWLVEPGVSMKELPRLEFDGGVDGDGHVLEPPDLWERYLEPRYRDSPSSPPRMK